jgi:Nucleotide modification associated domain 1
MNMKEQYEQHKMLLQEIHNTYVAKNIDYGNSFSDQFKEYGLISSVIRMDDKMRRIKQLMNNEAQVKDESILDSVKDLANYAIMTAMEIENASDR